MIRGPERTTREDEPWVTLGKRRAISCAARTLGALEGRVVVELSVTLDTRRIPGTAMASTRSQKMMGYQG